MTSMTTRRFVVLEHSPSNSDEIHLAANCPSSTAANLTNQSTNELAKRPALHWDWMFESDGKLETWATEPIPGFLDWLAEARPATIRVACWKLPAHRLDYLEYAGTISGNRGTVKPVLRGNLESDPSSANVFCCTVEDSDIGFEWRILEILSAHKIQKDQVIVEIARPRL